MGNTCCAAGGQGASDAGPSTAPLPVIGSSKLREKYELLRLIGKGHYGLVYAGKAKETGQNVAIKILQRSKSRPHRLKLEVEILRLVGQHRNVVSLLDAFETEPAVELVFELMEGGELFERLVSKGPYKEARALVIIKHLADALAFIHSKGVVHRDLKPENLLLDCADEKRALVKLADFGLSHLLGPGTTHMTTVCGTWAYSAPEVRINRQKYTHKVDTWSLGVIMFVVLSGYHPFDPDGVAPEEELQRNIKYGNVDFDDDVWTGVSGAAQDLIRRLLVVDPRRRYDTGDILAHPWITKNRHLWEEPPTGNHPPTARKADTTREAQAVGPSSMGSPPAGEPDSSAAGVGGAFILSPTADSHDEAIAAAANGGVGTFAKHHSSSSSAVAAAAAAPASLVPEASGEAERVPQAFGAMRHATAESGARTSSDLPQQSDADESCVGAVSVTPFMLQRWMEAQDAHVVPQQYEEHAHGRSLSTFVNVRNSTDTTPIRIKVLWTVVDGGGVEYDSQKGSLRTRSCSRAGQVIDVAPASGSDYEEYTCTPDDVVAPGSARYTVMQRRTEWAAEYWGSALTVKRTADPITISDGIATSYNLNASDMSHTGVDLVVIMIARPSPNSPVAGFAGCMQRDQHYRCTVGFFNWVPAIFDVENSLQPDAIASERHTAAHEMAHILGAVLLGPHFIDADTGTPIDLSTIATVEEQDATDYPKLVTKIHSPRVLAHAREAFGCPTLVGVPLEDVPLGRGAHWEARVLGPEFMSYGSFAGEVYVSDLTLAFLEDTNQYIANYTVAGRLVEPTAVEADTDIFNFLVSSDASEYEPPPPLSVGYLRWGRGEGCDFVNKGPVHWPERYVCTEHQDYGCSPDYRASAVCMLSVGIREVRDFTCGDQTVTSGGSFDTWRTTCPPDTNDNCQGGVCGLPSMYQYFGNTQPRHMAPLSAKDMFPTVSTSVAITSDSVGGVSSSMDYVPVRVKYWNCMHRAASASATNRSNEEGASIDASLFGKESDMDLFGGQENCPECRCFRSSLIEITKGIDPRFPQYGLCYRSNCYRKDYLQVGIRGVTQDKTFWYKCPAGGGKLYIAGFTGAVHCPPAQEFCSQNEVTGIKYAETDRLMEFIVWFSLAGVLVLSLIVCAVPACREPLVRRAKLCSGLLHLDANYRMNPDVQAVLKIQDDWKADPCNARALSALSNIIGLIAITVGGAVIWLYASSGLPASAAAPVVGGSVFALVLAALGIASTRARSKGVSCTVISYFFLSLFTVLALAFMALQIYTSDGSTSQYVDKNWDKVCPYYHNQDPGFCRETELDPQLREEAVEEVSNSVEGNMHALMGGGLVLVILLIAGILISLRIITFRVLSPAAFTILNWATLLCGVALFAASIWLTLDYGQGTAALAAFTVACVMAVFMAATSIIGLRGAFASDQRLLTIHLWLVAIAVLGTGVLGIGMLMVQAAAEQQVDRMSDEEIAEVTGQFNDSMSRSDLKLAVGAMMKTVAYCCFVLCSVNALLAFFNIYFSRQLGILQDEIKAKLAALKEGDVSYSAPWDAESRKRRLMQARLAAPQTQDPEKQDDTHDSQPATESDEISPSGMVEQPETPGGQSAIVPESA